MADGAEGFESFPYEIFVSALMIFQLSFLLPPLTLNPLPRLPLLRVKAGKVVAEEGGGPQFVLYCLRHDVCHFDLFLPPQHP